MKTGDPVETDVWCALRAADEYILRLRQIVYSRDRRIRRRAAEIIQSHDLAGRYEEARSAAGYLQQKELFDDGG